MKIVEDDGNLGHSLNLGDLDMYRIVFLVNGRRTCFFWDSFLHGGMECPAKNHVIRHVQFLLGAEKKVPWNMNLD